MKFDARVAKMLLPGEHITFESYPGLRLKATASGRTWTYRYKSPLDGRMRQVKIGGWPSMSFPAAIVAWDELRAQRDAGGDLAMDVRTQRAGLAQHWAPHDLRRTSRTFLAALGCPSDVGEVIVGHMLSGVERTYNRHTYDIERQVWLKRLSRHLEKIAAHR